MDLGTLHWGLALPLELWTLGEGPLPTVSSDEGLGDAFFLLAKTKILSTTARVKKPQ